MVRKDYYRMAHLEVLMSFPIPRPECEPSSQDAAFALLRAGVPLSLLLDLAAPVHSSDLLLEEPADTSWVPHAVA